jgi:hypothetical protein
MTFRSETNVIKTTAIKAVFLILIIADLNTKITRRAGLFLAERRMGVNLKLVSMKFSK